MNNDNYDQALTEADALNSMFETPGWAIAEREFNVLITTLKDVTLIDTSKEDVLQQVRDRINTAAALNAWLDDLKGRVNNAKYLAKPDKQSNLIVRR